LSAAGITVTVETGMIGATRGVDTNEVMMIAGMIDTIIVMIIIGMIVIVETTES
jgi:hypothetical protein